MNRLKIFFRETGIFKGKVTGHSTPIIMLWLLLLLSASFLAGCSVHSDRTYTRDGKVYGTVSGAFRERWWNFYERGLSYAEGEFYQEALFDLREALKQRDKDQRMARTYGMHFLDYFPHRELGIVYYSLGNMEAALQELEVSISQYPSSKARYYLDQVRKALIELEGKEVEPPKISLSLKESEFWTRDDPVVLSGVVEDEHYISDIQINRKALFIEGAQKQIIFKEALGLSQGEHLIEIRAKNLPGKVSRQQVIVHVDREGPVITLEELKLEQSGQKGQEGTVTIQGSVFDESGILDLRINGESIPLQDGPESVFTKKLNTSRPELELIAHDRLGNKTATRISLTASSSTLKQAVMLASADSSLHLIAQGFPFSGPIQDSPLRIRDCTGEPCVRAMFIVQGFPFSRLNRRVGTAHRFVTRNMVGNAQPTNLLMLASILGPKDTQPPEIILRDWSESQVVFLPKIYLEGEVRDDRMIESLTINQKSILRRKGKRVFFSYLADLNKGENMITVEARDEAKNKAIRKIKVIRQVPKALQLAERLSLTVLPFEQQGPVSEFSLAFQDHLIYALIRKNRFRIVEREQLDTILQEQNLSSTRVIDQATAIRLGRLAAAQSVITGRIIEGRAGLEIVARLIDTETSEILAIYDVYDEVKDVPALRNLAEGLSLKLLRDFPLLDGNVVDHKGNYIFTDLGAAKIGPQKRLIVYREEPLKHPVSGKILGSDNLILGRARVNQVMPEISKGEIVSGESSAIKTMDKVITE